MPNHAVIGRSAGLRKFMTKDHHNEHIKLLAAALNNVAVAMLVTGIIAPAVSGTVHGGRYVAVIFVWLTLAIALHLTAQGVLGALR
jgi:hypothetical protein